MIDFIKPPTDNLYKFQALAGLLLILISLIYPPWLFHQATLGYLAAENEKGQLEIQRQFSEIRRRMLEDRMSTVIKHQADLQKQIDELQTQDSGRTDSSKANISVKLDGLQTKLQESTRNSEALADASHELAMNLSLKMGQMKHQQRVSQSQLSDSRVIVGCGLLGLVIGVAVTVRGFYKWGKRVQVFQDAILKKQATAGSGASTQATVED